MYDALARLSSQIPEAYEHASEFGDLHLGDLHLLEITGEDEENKDGNANHWVALAVVQTYNPRRKVPRSSISIPELEQCLSKASFSAAQKGRLRSTCCELVIRMGQIGQKGTRLNVLLGNMLLILHKDICVHRSLADVIGTYSKWMSSYITDARPLLLNKSHSGSEGGGNDDSGADCGGGWEVEVVAI
ncbi:putative Macro domain-containing protein [Helianthus annuus]|nr:putative Macro domain-containing protein [Helianthus annuus]KAJ0897055.1 putative Macro domain-containing protein [Helianthus annuus]